ncbi:DUF3164 family protein [Malaciobacter marinus]|uniref:DUF3164 family protein n=1 Tax=Malaciobacter marinus TaxID=505249 RepID=UPI003B00FCFD
MAVIKNGKWQNKEGDFIHPDMVRVDKQIEDELVEGLVDSALVLQKQIKEFKIKAFAECYAFVDLLKQQYDMERITSKVGAVTLKSFNGTKEVQIQVAKLITFDQKLTLAKEKIDEYLTHKTENLDSEIQTLITRAFDVKNGKVDAKQIIGLKSYNITHPKWKEAMAMIDEATEVAGTKSYIRFKQRAGLELDGAWQTVVLDIAALPVQEIEIQLIKGELEKNKGDDK